MAFTDPFDNTAPATITPPLGAVFSNTAAAAHDLTLTAAFSNTAAGAHDLPLATAFSNTAAGAHDLPLSAAFSNTKPGKFYTGEERYLAVCAPAGNQNVNQLIAGHTTDGVTLADGDLVLLTQQNQAEHNGIYLVNGAGYEAIRYHPMTKPFSVRIGPNSTRAANKVFSYIPLPNFVLETTHITFVDITAAAHPL